MRLPTKSSIVSLLFYSSAFCVPSLLAEDLKPAAVYDKSSALIIGIEQYALAAAVPGAVEEAKQVAQAFRQLGFEDITEIYNKEATSRRLHQALTDLFIKKGGRKGRVVVFFAGHTGTTRDTKGKDVGYFVPADVQINNVAKSLTVETLREFTRRSASKHTLLIIDGPIRGWDTAPKPAPPATNGDARAVQVIAAADKGETSARADGKTVFLQALLTGLAGAADSNRNGSLTASELGAYIKQQVDAATQGLQHVASLRIEGDGDTILSHGYQAHPGS